MISAAVAPRIGLAQTAQDKVAAEALYDEGKKLLAEKRFAEACTRFERSQRLDPGTGTLLFLADCYEIIGRTASAWSTFREAAASAKATNQPDRERIARERAAKLDDRLFQLTLSVAAASTPGLRVVRDETEVKKEVWGIAVPVDPGAYKLTVTAPGKKSWTSTVEIPKEAGSRTVEIPELEDAPAPPPEPTASASASAAPTVTAAPPPPPPAGMSPGRTVGITVGAVGLVGLAAGAVVGGLAAAQYGDVKAACPNTACGDSAAVDLSNQVGTLADVSTTLFVAGGVLLAGGVVLFLVSPASRPSDSPRTSWISPMIGSGAAGFRAGSTF